MKKLLYLLLLISLPGLSATYYVSPTGNDSNALIVPAGVIAMIWDKTLGVLKVWDGTKWKIYISNE